MGIIRPITIGDVNACAQLLLDAYNCEPWSNRWTMEKARRYLTEFVNAERFTGFLMEEDGRAVAAAFCHSRTWWTGDELYVDEFYVATDMQKKGLGGRLMAAVTQAVRDQGLNGVTLLTDRRFPAMEFYTRQGFEEAGNVVFLYRVVE